jgi:predicted metal-dependent phosphoesterase TrpH
MAIDLHLHTQGSDGTWTPKELVRQAKAVGLKAIAVTDHDAVASVPEAAVEAQQANLTFIPGVEISASLTNKLALHILGYGIHPESPELQSVLAKNQVSWEQSEYDSIENLAKLGIRIDPERYRYWRTDRTRGGWPLCNTLQEMGVINGLGDYFGKYFGEGCPAYVEILFVLPQEAIKAIQAAGGVPVLAHPGLYKEDGKLLYKDPGFIEQLTTLGIEGIEAYNGEHTEEATADLLALAQQKGLLITGGSDCHGEFAGRCIGKPVVDDRYLAPLLHRIQEHHNSPVHA